jgi:hypothetical protein
LQGGEHLLELQQRPQAHLEGHIGYGSLNARGLGFQPGECLGKLGLNPPDVIIEHSHSLVLCNAYIIQVPTNANGGLTGWA